MSILLALVVVCQQDKTTVKMFRGTIYSVNQERRTVQIEQAENDIVTLTLPTSASLVVDGKSADISKIKDGSRILTAATKDGETLFRLSIETAAGLKAKAEAAKQRLQKMKDDAAKHAKELAESAKKSKDLDLASRKKVSEKYDRITGVTYLRSTDIDGGFYRNAATFHMDAIYHDEGDENPTVSLNFVVLGGTSQVGWYPTITFLCDNTDRFSLRGRDIAGLFDGYTHIDIPLPSDRISRITKSKQLDIKMDSLARSFTEDDIEIIKHFAQHIAKENEKRRTKKLKP